MVHLNSLLQGQDTGKEEATSSQGPQDEPVVARDPVPLVQQRGRVRRCHRYPARGRHSVNSRVSQSTQDGRGRKEG
jgi:hypothetical protein